jgi:hypothetical protein
MALALHVSDPDIDEDEDSDDEWTSSVGFALVA